MKKRIFFSMCLIALAAVFLSSGLVALTMYDKIHEQMRQQLIDDAALLKIGLEQQGSSFLTKTGSFSINNRITYIAPNGKVLYDSAQASSTMENHLSRPEVTTALQEGTGEDARLSATLGEKTFYYAVKLKDGSVLRLSNTIDSVFASFAQCLPLIFTSGLIVFLLALFLSGFLTKKIIRPINALDPAKPLVENDKIYNELQPLVYYIAKQKEQINNQIQILQKKQEEFAKITENMREGLVLLNNKAQILSLNERAARIFRIDKNMALGENVLLLDRSPYMQSAIDAALKQKTSEETISLEGRDYQLLVNPVMEKQYLSGIVILILDITEQRQAENMRREFSANVSHELKTPLTSISGYSELLKNNLVKPEDIPDFAAKIHDETKRLITLINDIIKLSQLDETDGYIKSEPVNLLAVAQEVVKNFAATALEKQLELTVQGKNMIIIGEYNLLYDMLYNLCDNAVKYNKPGGFVNIAVTEQRGIGIPAEHQSRIFERFYRVDKSHSKETGGTGLGLSIVKHIVQRHNAQISLTSRLEQGTAIQIIFPKQNLSEDAEKMLPADKNNN